MHLAASLANGGAGSGTMDLPESKMRELCREAAFSSVRRAPLEHSVHNVYEALV